MHLVTSLNRNNDPVGSNVGFLRSLNTHFLDNSVEKVVKATVT